MPPSRLAWAQRVKPKNARRRRRARRRPRRERPAVLPTAIDELWRWHGAHELDCHAPPCLVERANAQHAAEVAAHRGRTCSPAWPRRAARARLARREEPAPARASVPTGRARRRRRTAERDLPRARLARREEPAPARILSDHRAPARAARSPRLGAAGEVEKRPAPAARQPARRNAPAVLPTAIDELVALARRARSRPSRAALAGRARDQSARPSARRAAVVARNGVRHAPGRSALDEIAAGMVSHAERCDANARLAPRLARIGHEADAEKVASCRTSGRFVQRESDARFIPFPDSKCRRPRCARTARAMSGAPASPLRQAPAAWRARTRFIFHRLAVKVPADRLRWAWRELLADFDALRRTTGRQEHRSRARHRGRHCLAPGLHHPHLHAIVAAAGRVGGRLGGTEEPAAARASRRWSPAMCTTGPRRTISCASSAWTSRRAPCEVQHRGKCRVVCDLAADVVRFSDGASLTVAGCSRGSRAAGWRTLTAWCGR